MRRGHLSNWFTGVAWKRLTAVEALPHKSNQHEFDGVHKLKAVLGFERRRFSGTVAYLMDDDPEPIRAETTLTWYDARERIPKRSEWRLYYPTTFASERYNEGDLLIIARRADDTLLVMVAEEGSTIESQLMWLFGLGSANHPGFSVKGEIESGQLQLEFASNFVLELIGEKVDDTDESCLDVMIRRFGMEIPPAADFATYVRSNVTGVEPLADPDRAIMAWMNRDDVLSRTLERHRIGERLSLGFGEERGGFGSFSNGVQVERIRRRDAALACHLAHLFDLNGLAYDMKSAIAGSPDFLFPSAARYLDDGFATGRLSMLAVQSRTWERWREVTAQAIRIPRKHLYTLEPSLTPIQVNEMAGSGVRVIVPAALQATYMPELRSSLTTTSEFLGLLKNSATDTTASGGELAA